MKRLLLRSLLLLLFTVVIICVIYPLALLVVGHVLFPFQAHGSLERGPDGAIVGSRLIAQAFTKDEYFHPRPSAAAYDASASAASCLAASNYLLRDRVARSLGPIVRYRRGPRAGQLVASDIEAWFQRDTFQGLPGIVAQWAVMHSGLALNWVTSDSSHQAYTRNWLRARETSSPTSSLPVQPGESAVAFFQGFSREFPGQWPVAGAGPAMVDTGAEIQAVFFDLWRQDNPEADLAQVPADMVTASGSGLDPHITLANAEEQLDRVAAGWAAELKRDPDSIRSEIRGVLLTQASAPMAGLFGEKLVNVLEVNLELSRRFGTR
jgi:K+-transporting ATPase ATPase C chain